MTRFNSLERGARFEFVLAENLGIVGVLHEILSDGTLLVAGNQWGVIGGARPFRINPDHVLYAVEVESS
jgi:hypothetical protein